jgi:hypothetical protein
MTMPCTIPTKICNFNRHYAEFSGYWNTKTSFLKVALCYNPATIPPSRTYHSSAILVLVPLIIMPNTPFVPTKNPGVARNFQEEEGKGEEITFYDSVTVSIYSY